MTIAVETYIQYIVMFIVCVVKHTVHCNVYCVCVDTYSTL